MPGPRHPPARDQHVDDGRGARWPPHEIDAVGVPAEPVPDQVRVIHRRRQSDPPHLRRDRLQPAQAERQKIAALGRPQRVDLVDDHAAEVLEQPLGAFPGQQQRQLLGRRQQHVRRLQLLALLARHAGVAGAGLGDDVQAHLVDGRQQVALDIDGQRLQRRQVQGVDAARTVRRRPFSQLDQARQKAGKRLAAAGRGDQQGVAALPPLLDHRQLMLARGPAAAGEPVGEARRQRRGGDAVHGVQPLTAFASRLMPTARMAVL